MIHSISKQGFQSWVVIVSICVSFQLLQVRTFEEGMNQIKFIKDVVSHVSEISQQYSVVKDSEISRDKTKAGAQNVNQRFKKSLEADHFVKKNADPGYQKIKLESIKGKDIFTHKYITENIPIQEQGPVEDPFQTNTQYDEQNTGKKNQKITPKMGQNSNQQIIQQESNRLYQQLKNLGHLKQKNLHSLTNDDQQSQAKKENFQKLILYIVVGLALSFVIIKKATKDEATIPSVNEQKNKLRLRDAIQEDDNDQSSDQSDQ